MSEELPIFNLSNKAHVRMVCEFIKTRQGLHRVSISKCKDQRSLRANGFYWAVIVPCVVRGLEEAWGETLTPNAAHEFLKSEFNPFELHNRKTGEVKVVGASTADLDTAQFAEYLDKVIKFCGEQLGVEVPSPGEYETVNP